MDIRHFKTFKSIIEEGNLIDTLQKLYEIQNTFLVIGVMGAKYTGNGLFSIERGPFILKKSIMAVKH